MRLPFHIIDNLPSTTPKKWQKQFVETGRARHEGIWRRTQEPVTNVNSGYSQPDDARWKLVHFFDEYNITQTDNEWSLVLEKPYIWVNTALPQTEMDEYYDNIKHALAKGGWLVTSHENGITAQQGDVTANLQWMDKIDAEAHAARILPDGYVVLDVEVFGPVQHLSDEERDRPWRVLRRGIRQILTPGTPSIFTPEDSFDLSPYLPFHLEMGCGPSIEAGVPPLSHLHKTYAISDPKTHRFLIGKDDDLLERFFACPEEFYMAASLIYATALKAQPTTLFYQSVKRLYDAGHILPPVYTNNYDGLIADVGMAEHYLRKFDDAHLVPDVDFDPRAKALIVVGSHADRRKLQEKARQSGLQVIYVDPEQYEDEGSSSTYHYGLEAPQDNDIILQMTAQTFAETVLRKY